MLLKKIKWGVPLIKWTLIQTHSLVVWFRVSCMRQHNEWINDLFPALNIHHLFITFHPEFIILIGEAFYKLTQPSPPSIKRRCLGLLLAYRNSWTLDAKFGRWTLDAGLWTLDAELLTLDSGCWTLDCGRQNFEIQNCPKLWKQWIHTNNFVLEFCIDKRYERYEKKVISGMKTYLRSTYFRSLFLAT